MCSENMTSLGRREDPFDLKKEGVVTLRFWRRTSLLWPNHYQQWSQAARLPIEKTSPTNFASRAALNLSARKTSLQVRGNRANVVALPQPGLGHLSSA